jgi:hypothetical protein
MVASFMKSPTPTSQNPKSPTLPTVISEIRICWIAWMKNLSLSTLISKIVDRAIAVQDFKRPI